MSQYHEPVLLKESIEGLKIDPAGIYVDATFGGGGHSKKILEMLHHEGRLIAFDQDADAAQNQIDDPRFLFISQNFRHMKKMLRLHSITSADGILADLGISSFQIDTAARGFAHRLNGPLDMRMNRSLQHNAEDILNSYNQQQLQRIFGEYGQVRNARTLANTITAARDKEKIDTIDDFVKVISPVIKGNRNKYLSQVFQALRIEVNDELNALKEFLGQAKEILKTGGRLVVISYHSLEDRIIKNFIRYGNTLETQEEDLYGGSKKHFIAINKKPIVPAEKEVTRNPRAHSARMRIAEKL